MFVFPVYFHVKCCSVVATITGITICQVLTVNYWSALLDVRVAMDTLYMTSQILHSIHVLSTGSAMNVVLHICISVCHEVAGVT